MILSIRTIAHIELCKRKECRCEGVTERLNCRWHGGKQVEIVGNAAREVAEEIREMME